MQARLKQEVENTIRSTRPGSGRLLVLGLRYLGIGVVFVLAVGILFLYPVSILNNVIANTRPIDGLDLFLGISGLVGGFVVGIALAYPNIYRGYLYLKAKFR